MATKKTKIERALKQIEAEKKAREDAKRREKEQRDTLLMELGRVLDDAAVKPTSEWATYRNRSVAELLTALGLEVVGETSSEAPQPVDSDQSAGWSG